MLKQRHTYRIKTAKSHSQNKTKERMDVEEEKRHEHDEEEEDDSNEGEAPPPISCGDVVLDVDCHPKLPITCAALVSGELEIFKQINDSGKSDDAQNVFRRIAKISKLHRGEACRTISFNADGTALFTGGSDSGLHGIDCSQGKTVWTCFNAHDGITINRVSMCLSEDFSPLTLLSGDENGTIKLWDCREKPDAAKFSFPGSHLDFVSDFCYSSDDKRLLTTGGDGTLSVFDLRRIERVKGEARSEEMETELLSVLLMKNGKKVVCGTNEGPIAIFKYGTWDLPVDSITGHPHSVDCLLKLDEDTMLTGSSDGIIRIVRVQPHKLLGVIGFHDDFPVERMKFAFDKRFVASCSHDNIVRFWDTGFLVDGMGFLKDMEQLDENQIGSVHGNNGSGEDEDDFDDDLDDSSEESDDATNSSPDEKRKTTKKKAKKNKKDDPDAIQAEEDEEQNDSDDSSAVSMNKSKPKAASTMKKKLKSAKALLIESTVQAKKKKKTGPQSKFFDDL